MAAIYENEQLSFAELNGRANRLAYYYSPLVYSLIREWRSGVERRLDMVVAILAVLKAGGACVPLDPDYPAERLRFMLEDSFPLAVLTDGALPVTIQGLLSDMQASVINVTSDVALWSGLSREEPRVLRLISHHLAYIIYTSGSTGRPRELWLSTGAFVVMFFLHETSLSSDLDIDTNKDTVQALMQRAKNDQRRRGCTTRHRRCRRT